MIKVFTYRIVLQDEMSVVKDIIHAALPGVDFKEFPMPQFSPDKCLDDGDVAITFGTAPALAIQDCEKVIQQVKLPAPKMLVSKAGNEPSRDVAWNSLKELGKKLTNETFTPTDIRITAADMPDLDAKHLLMLKKLTEKSNSKFCVQVSRNGKTIVIGDSIPTEIQADIKISFEELYTVKNVMDILKVDSVELVNL